MEYDTIVVGGGSSGAVIAARLTEDSDRPVLLLEAGPDPVDAWPRDLLDGRMNSLRAHDWGYTHRPTPGQIRMPLPRGRVMGGSSSVNTCIALRGTPADYDEWGALGATGWSWAECLPYFRRLERDLDVGKPGVDTAWHGVDGPIPIRRPAQSELSPWQLAFDEACARVGYPASADTNAPDAVGHGAHASNRLDGERWNVARAYLTAAVRARPHLSIRPDTLVRRALFEGTRCTGVEVETAGTVSTVRARRVVMCGGAVSTPGVLLRSGIGSEDAVRRVGANPVARVPAVGARLLDHAGAAFFFMPIRTGVVDFTRPIIQNTLRVPSRLSGLASDLQLQAGAYAHFPWTRLPLVSLMANIGKPRGSGTIIYDSHDPHAAPHIESRLLEHPDDKARLVEAMTLVHELAQQEPLRKLARLLWPRPSAVSTPQRMAESIVRVSGSGYHPCGTVPMGAEGSPDAATDSRGRVRGVTGLYVGDASLMPMIPTSNINLATIMIGERMGEWLRSGD